VERLDWVSDPVTEERSVNLGFVQIPENVPVGELVEVTIETDRVDSVNWLPAAARRRVAQQEGVWLVVEQGITFRKVKFGISTLDGRVQVTDGLSADEVVIVHSQKPLIVGADIKVVDSLVKPVQ
jgi:hypothetical protein